jgi:isopentenyl-diphosphate delta-isomerase
MDERIIFADENDLPVGIGTRDEAWAKGIYVRIVRAVLRDENGRILSQRRSPSKKSYPDRWTDSASGHVDEGDSYDSAIDRELEEELGLNIGLTFIDKFTSKDIVDDKKIFEHNAVYEGTIDSSMVLNLQESEVSGVKWYDLSELKELMQKNPDSFTPGFRELINRFY